MASRTSTLNGSHVVLGSQQPRICHFPEYVSSTGPEAVELMAMAGLVLDPWQQLVLLHGLGELADGSWAALEVALEAPRQNGKNSVLEGRELAGLFLLGEQLLIHSAHEFPTAEAELERMAVIMESCPDFDRRVKSIKRSHGQEGIYLKGGQALRYRTRTKGGGRGLSADFLAMDECMHLPGAIISALFPTLSARENPQIWYAGSAPDRETMDNAVVFARLRERALRGDDPRLAYFGFSAPFEHPGEVTADVARDPVVWAQANPALGIRIDPGYVEAEQRSMSARGFAVERLGVGDWPPTESNPDRKIEQDVWDACRDPGSRALDPVCFSYDVTPDRGTSVICAAGWRPDGLAHIEVVEIRSGTRWVAGRLAELVGAHDPVGVLWAKGSPAASLSDAVEAAGVDAEPVVAEDHAKACGELFDALSDGTVRHLGTTELGVAVAGAQTRQHGEAWLWSRQLSLVNIAPLVGCTLALHGLLTIRPDESQAFDPANYRIGAV